MWPPKENLKEFCMARSTRPKGVLQLNKFMGFVNLANVAIFQQFYVRGVSEKRNQGRIEHLVEMIKMKKMYCIASDVHSFFFL